MSFIAILTLFLFSSCSHASTVLLTAFEPFGGSPKNGSGEVAKELERRRDHLRGKGIELRTCLLPVEYDRGAEVAKDCFRGLRRGADLVVSLGEAACDIRLETRFHNLDDTPGYPDNAGVVREKRVIDPRGREELPSSLPLADMYCAGPGKVGVNPSLSPGNYVCNGTAYRLQTFFSTARVPYGFVHVPNSGCGARYEDTADQLERMLVSAVAALAGKSQDPGWIPARGRSGEAYQPVSAAEAAERLRAFGGEGGSCARSFYREVSALYGHE